MAEFQAMVSDVRHRESDDLMSYCGRLTITAGQDPSKNPILLAENMNVNTKITNIRIETSAVVAGATNFKLQLYPAKSVFGFDDNDIVLDNFLASAVSFPSSANTLLDVPLAAHRGLNLGIVTGYSPPKNLTSSFMMLLKTDAAITGKVELYYEIIYKMDYYFKLGSSPLASSKSTYTPAT